MTAKSKAHRFSRDELAIVQRWLDLLISQNDRALRVALELAVDRDAYWSRAQYSKAYRGVLSYLRWRASPEKTVSESNRRRALAARDPEAAAREALREDQ